MGVTQHQQYTKETAKLLREGTAKVKLVDSSADLLDAENELFTKDLFNEGTLTGILKELKILNLHMSIMTDNTFTGQDVE